jgi:hypothetical protein
MAKLLIVRKSATKAPKLTKAKMAEALEKIDTVSRVSRPQLVELMLGGGYNKLPVIPQSEIDKAHYNRKIEMEGWEIPVEEMGRLKGEPNGSTRESVRLWIKQRLGEFGVPEDVTVILVD